MNMKKKFGNSIDRRRYKKVLPRLISQKKFLRDHARKEWEDIEKAARREKIYQKVKEGGVAATKIILTLLLITGVFAVGAVAPNVFSAFGRHKRRMYRQFFQEEELKKRLQYLQAKNYIRYVEKEDGIAEVSLTEFGSQKAVKEVFGSLKMIIPKSWDGIWRIVVFDIPNKHKWSRDGLRTKLQALGFYQMQKSVFVYPYPCLEEIRFLSAIYTIGDNEIRYIETNTIIHDADLRKFFNFEQ